MLVIIFLGNTKMESSLLNEKKLDKSSPEKAEKMNGENTVKVYGPYKRKDGRQHIVKVVNGVKTTQSYPRYIMEQHLGRELLPEETVDHIDEDFTNDDISNLRLISREENSKRSSWTYDKKDHAECVYCGTLFILSRNQRTQRSKKIGGPFCSRSCCGKYGAAIQNNRTRELFGNRKTKYVKIDIDGKITKKHLDLEKNNLNISINKA